MTPLDVRTDMDTNPWTHVRPADLAGQGRLESVGLLRHGTAEGRATVALLVKLEDGRYVVAETTWRLFNSAARALAGSPAAAEET
jgi:hypothetical protein